jgi:hypothetical protein
MFLANVGARAKTFIKQLTTNKSTERGSHRLNAVLDSSSRAAERLLHVLGFDLAQFPNRLHRTFVGRVPIGRIAASMKINPSNSTVGWTF